MLEFNEVYILLNNLNLENLAGLEGHLRLLGETTLNPNPTRVW